MHTFKRYLHETELSDLALELFLRSRAHLSKAAAKAVAEWYRSPNVIAPWKLPDDGWDLLVDWADREHSHNNPKEKSIHDLSKGAVPLPLIVKGVLARSFRRYQQSVNEGELHDLSFVLGIRKVLGCTREQAQELVLWLKGEKDWEDLEHDARGPVLDMWDPDVVEDEKHPGMSYEDYVMDELSIALKHVFKLDTRELIGP